ncbi:MAG: 1-deoxy-D-xylulose-5-phosphate synthase [Bacillota bacterium]
MTDFLNQIDQPKDLNDLNQEEMQELADEIREFLICTVAETGGHLASNLGVVELTLALHRHLNSPQDKIIWDVGHQSYTHKIITGRREEMPTIRKYQGLSGYPKRKESSHDIIETGHSGTSISSALGLALARDHRGSKDRIYAVIGDGAITGGMAFEALNHGGALQTDFNIVLNDNEMSISKNVGALAGYLSRLRTEPALRKITGEMKDVLNAIPGIGSGMYKTMDKAKDSLKYFLVPGILFEEMGYTYLGPVPGHDLEALQDIFTQADKVKGPVIIHVNTVKGKGYNPAESCPSNYHGVSPFKIEDGQSRQQKTNKTYSQVFGETVVNIAETDMRTVAITAAMPAGTGLDHFQERFPERFYDVGIAEQHALTMAAGLARGGMRPFVALYSTFLQRGYDQLIHDLAIQNLPVTIGIDRAGIVGSDGETHQGLFDLSYLRAIPNVTVMAPKDEQELVQMLKTAHGLDNPAAVRYPRGEGSGVELDFTAPALEVGTGELLRTGEDILVVAVGSMVEPARKAIDKLGESGFKVGLYNARFVKPLPAELLDICQEYDKIITIEENVLQGGFGSAVMETLAEAGLQHKLVKRIGIPDTFVRHGGQEQMRDIYGLSSSSIADLLKNYTATK